MKVLKPKSTRFILGISKAPGSLPVSSISLDHMLDRFLWRSGFEIFQKVLHHFINDINLLSSNFVYFQSLDGESLNILLF